MLMACVLLLAATLAVGNDGPKDTELASTNVMAFGAKADGKSDDAAAFQKALDVAAAKGGIVMVPAGTYLVAGALNVPQGVTLRGVWEGPHHADIGKGSVIYATGGAGDEHASPLITLNQSSAVRGLTFFYPEQDIENVKPYPWTIRGNGMHCSVIDVTLVNPYKGIDFGTNWNELHYISNVFGCPLNTGIFVDQTTDIGRIENVHFNPHSWGRAAFPTAPQGEKWAKLLAYLEKNLTGFVLGQTDWEYMNNCFVIFPKIGYHFIRSAKGSPNAVLTQCGSDIGPVAVQVDSSQAHSGIAFSNSQFMSQVVIGPENQGPVKFSNCGFWPIEATDTQAVIQGSGTVTFTSCHFADWARRDKNSPCVLAKSGSVILNGCEFVAEGKKQVELGPGTVSAAIYGCRFRGGQSITNKAPKSADVQIGMNIR
jgi:hypothetical protein